MAHGISIDDPDARRIWFGRHDVRGWVLLDRRLSVNGPSLLNDLVFVQMSNWRPYREMRSNWLTPGSLYVYEKIFFARLPHELAIIEAMHLRQLKQEYVETGHASCRPAMQQLADEIQLLRPCRLDASSDFTTAIA